LYEHGVRRIALISSAIVLPGLACGDRPDSPLTDVVLDDSGEPASTGDDTTGDDTTSGSSAGDGTAGHDATTTTPDTSTTAPATTCGDGVVDDGEDCDGAVALACAALDPEYTWGDVACTGDCRLDTAGCQTCQAPAIVPCDPQSDAVFHALELGCPDLEGWTPGNGVPLVDRRFASPDLDAYRVLRRFGDLLPDLDPLWAPRAGERMLLLGTGKFLALDLFDVLLMPPGAASAGGNNNNPEADDVLPPPMIIDMTSGSASGTPFLDCDGEGDCSQTLALQWLPAPRARDIAYLDFQVRVPAGTRGYALDLALFTAHYPEFAAPSSTYNDMAIVWVDSEAYVGNISHLVVDGVARPLALPSLSLAGLMTHDGASDPALLGTGYDGLLGATGGATDWLTLHGPAVPGETLTLALAVLDLDDSALDSALLVDNFRWRCESCTLGAPATAGGCGLRPATR
jgi:hypothetical protein